MNFKRLLLSHFVLGGLGFLIFLYILTQFLSVALPPKIVVTSPPKNETKVSETEILIRGFVKRTYFFKINGELVAFNEKGYFEKSTVLQNDLNTFNLEAESRFGKKTSYQFKVLKIEN